MPMLTLLTISVLLTVLYTGAVTWKRRKLPESISAMVFELPTRWRVVWSLWLALVTLFLYPALSGATTSSLGSLASGATIVCLAMTAAMPLVPGNYNNAHYVTSIAAGIFSQVSVFFICPWCLLSWLAVIVLPYIDGKWNVPGLPMWLIEVKVLIMEALCSISLFGALYVYHF